MPSNSVSIIVEWDNVRLAELGRCRAMLRQLARQASALCHSGCGDPAARSPRLEVSGPIELLVLHDPGRVDRRAVQAVLDDELGAAPPGLSVRLIDAPGMAYYELKNHGVRHAQGSLIVFMDSDVVPEPDWLEELIQPLARPDVQIVGGNTYVDATGLYSRAVALTWFFPLREQARELRTTDRFFANNVAARRALLEAHPFPIDPGAARGACLALSHQLADRGIPIYRNPAAQASHPAPAGLRHFLRRAIADGRDHRIYAASSERSTRATVRHFYYEIRRAISTVRKHGASVRLSPAAAPAAAAIGASYYLLGLAASLATLASPRFMKQRFQL
jgi:hypothetical protein